MRDGKTSEATVESNLGLVHALAAPYRGRGVPYDDLVQEGTLGLMRAVERFDPGRGVKFSTYAAWWIRSALIDALGQAQVIRIPAKARRGPASPQGVARVTASLDEPVGEDGTALAELVADPDPVDPWRHVSRRETRRRLWSLLKILPKRHREVLVRRYGVLTGGEAQSHAQIAAALGIGPERSRQLEHAGLGRLRALAAGHEHAA